jgi:4-methyl-5(b-hydroxyethyl)-thiazole monophosphate biosynthesis
MKRVCVLLADGFEEIEAVTDIEVDVLGVTGDHADGAHGITLACTHTLASQMEANYDAVILPGGMPGAAHLRDSDDVRAFVLRHVSEAKIVGAICAAPMALGHFGVLEGRRACCDPGFEKDLIGAKVDTTATVVRDGRIITSRGPGTALRFALSFVRELHSDTAARGVARTMLVPV